VSCFCHKPVLTHPHAVLTSHSRMNRNIFYCTPVGWELFPWLFFSASTVSKQFNINMLTLPLLKHSGNHECTNPGHYIAQATNFFLCWRLQFLGSCYSFAKYFYSWLYLYVTLAVRLRSFAFDVITSLVSIEYGEYVSERWRHSVTGSLTQKVWCDVTSRYIDTEKSHDPLLR
jgi:hypothetical protein